MNKKGGLLVWIIVIVVVIGVIYFASSGVLFAPKNGKGKPGGGGGSETQCNDGADNDGDGQCDYSGCQIGKGRNKQTLPADSDCTSESDDSEATECTPTTEVCDGVDNDCDGTVDEGLVQQCGVSNVGICEFGTQTCSGGTWGSCVGNVDPSTEICDGTFDNDCDGNVDEGCSCTNGQSQGCGSNVGQCISGNQTCAGGQWGACVGEVGPSTEVCDGVDNNCDGTVDEGCQCIDDETQSCGSDVGACQSGSQICTGGQWGTCVGDIGPSVEVCDGIDNNCNGLVDEGDVCGSGNSSNSTG